MPQRPPRIQPVNRPLHRRENRPSSAARGYGSRWRRLRASIIAARPACQACGTKPSRDVDHVVSRAKGGTDDPANLVALCHSCHSKKTVAVDNGFGRGR